jgi:hypothetical protein
MQILKLSLVTTIADCEVSFRRRMSPALPSASRFFHAVAVTCMFAGSFLFGQGLPAGTVVPIMLKSEISSKKTKAGQEIVGRVMQDIVMPSGARVKSGADVKGLVVEVTRPAGGGSRIVVTFSELDDHGHTIPLSASLRALASSEGVYQAGLPSGASSNASGSDDWVTMQIGGDVVNRGRGAVGSNNGIVGKWSDGGVWAKLTPAPQLGCPADEGNDRVQSMWVFSTSACGVYGLPELKLVHDGRDDPVGMITLESAKDISIRGGSGWLLLVNNRAPTVAAAR